MIRDRRDPDRQLANAPRRPRQQKISDVRAPYEQDKADCAQKRQKNGTQPSYHDLADRDDVHADIGVERRIGLRQLFRDHVHLGAGLVKRDPWLEPCDGLKDATAHSVHSAFGIQGGGHP
jgi:hypothetical protein